MSNLNTPVNWYLSPPRNAFWNWSPDGEAVVWVDDDHTIAFRTELEAILKRHVSKGLPPLGSVLLIIAVCRDSWAKVRLRLKNKSTFTALLSEEFRQLDKLHGIPPELRTWIASKAELSAMIFETTRDRTSPLVAGAVVDAISNGLALEFVRVEHPAPATARQLLNDLKPLGEGLRGLTWRPSNSGWKQVLSNPSRRRRSWNHWPCGFANSSIGCKMMKSSRGWCG